MPRKRLPEVATDPLYEGKTGPSKVEADDVAEDIAAVLYIAKATEPKDAMSPGFTNWLQRKKPG